MSLRSFVRLPACAVVLTLAATVAGCGPGPSTAWTGPGWYLERPYITVVGGPKVFGGPFTYDKCEEERLKLGPDVASDMLCALHPLKPAKYGLY